MRPSLPPPSPSTGRPPTAQPASQNAPNSSSRLSEALRTPVPRPLLQRQRASQSPGHEGPTSASLNTNFDPAVSTDESATDSDASSNGGVAMEGRAVADTSQGKGQATRLPEKASELEQLRKEVDAKLRFMNQRVKLGGAGGTASPASLGARRVSPIKEEASNAMSPSLDAAFNSPLPTGAQTASTESTESTESGRTIRGSVPPTPAVNALRTPSYPFPYMPGTPRVWSSSFHQPFTTLSPTVSAMNFREHATPRETPLSDASTPLASAATFMPRGMSQRGSESEAQYPTPNLYDMVLLLNSEPGLDAWWSTVAKIFHDWYGADRITLAVPADATDLENVPWGQKATFNLAGHSEARATVRPQEAIRLGRPENNASLRPPGPSHGDTAQSGVSRLIGNRPRLETRHSYAGHEPPRRDVPNESARGRGRGTRPQGPLRTVSHATQLSPRPESNLRIAQFARFETPPAQTQRQPIQDSSFSDLDFSSVGDGSSNGPCTAVFPILRALDHEVDPLIDSGGINRVLERGKLVTLTRDYSPEPSLRHDSGGPDSSSSRSSSSDSSNKEPSSQACRTTAGQHRPGDSRNRAGNAGRSGSEHPAQLKAPSNYAEYEQFPTSPWAQSPAPSPAIQADPSENPFFATSNVDEDSFNPTEVMQDYSGFGQVEAIGIDRASTITHLPLIHPVLSYTMQNPHTGFTSRTPGAPRPTKEDRRAYERAGVKRRAPIAILSLLSPTVPFPQHLTQSLKLLGPHLATSFSNAYQYSSARMGLRHRRLDSGDKVDFASASAEPESLDSLLRLDIDDITESVAGSTTSPSDYSGHSRHSPGGSMTGTPGWDPSNIGFSSKHSVGSTPAHISGAEMIDSYFDAKKKTTLSKSNNNAASGQPQHSTHGGRSSPSAEARPLLRRGVTGAEEGEDTITLRIEQRSKKRFASREEKGTPVSQHRHEPSPSRTAGLASPRRPNLRIEAQPQPERRPHSLLHSYGADFSSTFQSLPAAATPTPRTPGPMSAHARGDSASRLYDMPPPSERLLRTIIDALPVQIFTAAPTTGALTWVNSKFLVYRGQDSRQVLDEPWQAIHADDRSEYMKSWNRSLRTGQQFSHKVRLQRFDGQYRWFYVRATPLKDKRQNIVHWIGTNMDFHEQHIAQLSAARQQETAASEAKYRALANSSPQIVFAVTKSKGVTFCNSQWLNYSGQTESEATGTGFMDYVHPEDLVKCRLPAFDEDGSNVLNVPTTLPPEPKRTMSSRTSSDESSETVTSPEGSPATMQLPQSQLSQLASTGILKVSRDADGRPSYATEVRLRSKDGNYRWHLVRILLAESFVHDEIEDETWYGTCTDINDHKLLERELKETMDAKSRFLSNMSHEIRTPLNGITGMVNLLIDSSLTSEQMEHVNIIRASTEGLRSLINDILDLSKAEAGMITLSHEWFHVRSLIEEVNDLTSTMAINKGLELNYLVEEDVPAMVKGDRFRVRQVLLNIIGNAIKFTDVGEVFVRCRTHNDKAFPVSDDEGLILFEIVDTGKGFSEDEAEYLFKRFSQIDGSSTRQHGGTGLGLAISRQLVELHGGKIQASSKPGEGSRFTFFIKFTLPSESDHPPMDPATAGLLTEPQTPAQDTPASVSPFYPSSVPVLGRELNESPAPYSPNMPHLSPSSASSDPSIRTTVSSIRSQRSSASSYVPDPSLSRGSSMTLELPTSRLASSPASSTDTIRPVGAKPSVGIASTAAGSPQPPLYSILVICPLAYAREATVNHIELTLPKSIPYQITARDSLSGCREMLGGENPVIFSHVVLVLQNAQDAVDIMERILQSPSHSSTSVVVISDLARKREIMRLAPSHDYDKLTKERRVRFIFKPLKPSKIGVIFDPQKEREMSTDRGRDSVQQVAVSQKQVFEEMKRRLGDKGHRVLMVEDNATNQMVRASEHIARPRLLTLTI